MDKGESEEIFKMTLQVVCKVEEQSHSMAMTAVHHSSTLPSPSGYLANLKCSVCFAARCDHMTNAC